MNLKSEKSIVTESTGSCCLDVGHLECQRSLVVSTVKPEDLPVIKMLLQNGVCKKASVAFVRDKEEALHGFVERVLLARALQASSDPYNCAACLCVCVCVCVFVCLCVALFGQL